VTTTADPIAVSRAQQLAETLLDRSGLELAPGADHDQVLALLAHVLYRYHPPDTEHGRLVVLALLPRPGTRPPAEMAVQRIVRGGRAPTPKAVQGQLRQAEESAAAWEARKARLRPLADQEGPEVAAAVEDFWRSRGKAPGPFLIGLRFGVAKRDAWAFVHLLIEGGWLSNTDRRLAPGPKAQRRPIRKARDRHRPRASASRA
jgi:hypothetical protein